MGKHPSPMGNVSNVSLHGMNFITIQATMAKLENIGAP
jgi:hypothetical protein